MPSREGRGRRSARPAWTLGDIPTRERDRSVDPELVDRLSVLLGRGRATVLRGLAVPTTTSILARSVGLSMATVSQHLSVLVSAGVAIRRRAGVRVLYALSPTGVALLGCLDEDPLAPRSSTGPAGAFRAVRGPDVR